MPYGIELAKQIGKKLKENQRDFSLTSSQPITFSPTSGNQILGLPYGPQKPSNVVVKQAKDVKTGRTIPIMNAANSSEIPINGVKYNTRALQEANFINIHPDKTGKTLLGTPRNLPSNVTIPPQIPVKGTPESTAGGVSMPQVNAQGLTMEQANDPKYWKNGVYTGVDQTALPTTPTTTPTNPAQSFQDAIKSLLTSAQGGFTSQNEDLLKQRNALIQARFGTRTATTPEELQGLSPDVQAALRSQDVSGLETQLGGIQTAMQAREQAKNNALDYLKSFSDQNKPIVVSENSTLIDPTTGQIIYKAPPELITEILTPNEAASLNVPYGTTKEEAVMLGIVPKSQLSSTDKIDLEMKLGKRFLDASKLTQTAQVQIDNINTSYKVAQEAMKKGQSINAASQGVLVSFQKLLDPTSVVRESEYARSGEGLSLLGKIEGKYTRLVQGGAGVSVNDLKEFVDLGNNYLQNYQKYQTQSANIIKKQAKNYGLNLENILPEKIADETTETNQTTNNDPFAGVNFNAIDPSKF